MYQDEINRELEQQHRGTSQNRFIPKASDPSLYLVRSKVGKEAQAIFEIYQQMRLLANSPQPYEVYSAFTNPASRGFIYIEAHKQAEVVRICNACHDLIGFKAKKVPLNQMIPSIIIPEVALKNVGVSGTNALIRQGTFVRIKSGVYKNDLGLVFRTIDGGSSAVVILIPRVDYNVMAISSGSRGRSSSLQRPQQSRFDTNLARAAGVDYHVVPGRDALGFSTFTQVKSQHFLNGLLFTVMPARSLIGSLQSYPPTTREMDIFRSIDGNNTADEDNEERTQTTLRVLREVETRLSEAIQDAEKYRTSIMGEDVTDDSNATSGLSNTGRNAATAAAIARSHGFARGDKVVVIRGELRGLEGYVLSISDQIIVQPTNIENLAPQSFSRDELGKRFNISERVMILEGPLRGTTGIVISIEPDLQYLQIVSDMSKELTQVKFENAVHHSAIVANDGSSFNIPLHSMVTAQGRQGCVVALNAGRVTLLDSDGTTRTISTKEITSPPKTRDARAAATDALGHTIQSEDNVIPLSYAEAQQYSKSRLISLGQSDVYAGLVCTVKHIIHSKLFLYNRNIRDHGGLFVIDAARVKKLMAVADKQQSSNEASSRVGYNAKFDPIRGKTVVITRGAHKGLRARVHSVQGVNDLLVELTAKSKRMQISRMDVQVVDDKQPPGQSGSTSDLYTSYQPGKTPTLGAQTPALGSQTPMYGSSGGRTGMYQGGKTPVLFYGDEENNPWSAKTPMHPSGTSPKLYDNEYGMSDAYTQVPFWAQPGAVVRSNDGQHYVIVNTDNLSHSFTPKTLIAAIPVIVSNQQHITRQYADAMPMEIPLVSLFPVEPDQPEVLVLTPENIFGKCISFENQAVIVQIETDFIVQELHQVCLAVDPSTI